MIVSIVILFMLLGAVDRMSGNHLGLGSEFEAGFSAMGPLVLGMAGLMTASDLIGAVLVPTVGRFFALFGASPAMAGSLLLSIDTGAYTLAHTVEPLNPDAANFSAIILASMLGPTIAFNIPVCLGMIRDEDARYLALGTFAGLLAIPFACIVGGFAAGFDRVLVLKNTLPVALIALLIGVGLLRRLPLMLRLFRILSRILIAVLTFFLALAIIKEHTDWQLPHILKTYMASALHLRPLSEVWETVGNIAVLLAGAYPLVKVLSKLLARPMTAISWKLGINDAAAAGLLAACANSVPAFSLIGRMNDRGKVIVIAFNTCSCFALGDYLGFCASVEPALVAPMLAGKFTGAILASMIALRICKRQDIV